MSQDDARLGSETSPLRAPTGEDFRFPARVFRESGAAIPLPPPSGQTSPVGSGQQDDRPAGNVLPPGPSLSSDHVNPQRSQATYRPAGFGPRTAPALGAAAPSWPRSGSRSTLPPRLLRLRSPGLPRFRSLSEGALPRRTRSSGMGTPVPDLDSVLRQRRRDSRRKGKGGKKDDQNGNPVIFISSFAFVAL